MLKQDFRLAAEAKLGSAVAKIPLVRLRLLGTGGKLVYCLAALPDATTGYS
jgi:hypothetical protein